MNDRTDGNQGKYPDGLPVLTPFPLTAEQAQCDRAGWPWMHAAIVSRAGPDEWQVVIQDGRATIIDEDGTPWYPVCFRDHTEIRLPDVGLEELREIFFGEYAGEGGYLP